MGIVVLLRGSHERAPSSEGYKSGRSSVRETPVSRSIGRTNSAATPRLDRSSQYQTCDCVVPIRSARGFCPPTTSQARFKAEFDMGSAYPFFGELQPKNLWGNNYRSFGNLEPMKPKSDSIEFGKRVRELREERGMSQGALGELTESSQQNIGWIEGGGPKDPRKYALKFAEALQSTPDWLLYGKGDRTIGVVPLSPEQFREIYATLDVSRQRVLTELVRHNHQINMAELAALPRVKRVR